MYDIYTKSHNLLMLLLLVVAGSLRGAAQQPFAIDVWDGEEVATALEGDGSKERPYEVATGADLKLVQSDEKYWKADVYIQQVDDIDLGGHPLGLIGYGDVTNGGKDFNTTYYHPFFATYNGGGHVIRNLRVNWDVTSDNKYQHSVGLFGLLAGTVRNLHLDNAWVTRSSLAENPNRKDKDLSHDMRIGILAGAMGPNRYGNKKVVVENIIISNSRIDDGGVATDWKTYFVGCIAGDITSSFAATNNITSSVYGYVHINNISVQADIDMSNCIRSTTDAGSQLQFNIGGFVGRMRRGKHSDLPVNVIFRGSVKAPVASIAPIYTSARCNGTNTNSSMNDCYLGEVLKSSTTTNTGAFIKLEGESVTIDGTEFYPDRDRYFSDYKIWNPAMGEEGGYEVITNSYPAAEPGRYNLRTLGQDGSTLNIRSPEAMRSWQGVNHGTYIDITTNKGASVVTNMLNSLNDPVKFVWDADTKSFSFSSAEQVALTRNTLHSVTASVQNASRSDDYIFSWTLTDTIGNTQSFEINKFAEAPYSNDIVTVAPSGNSCQFTINDDFRKYAKVSVTLYDDNGHSLSAADLELPDFSVTFTRSVDTDAKQYTFTPVFSFDGEDIDSDNALISPLTYEWNAYTRSGETLTLDNASIVGGSSDAPYTEPSVTVQQGFVGVVRLVVSDSEIPGKVYYMTGDGSVENNYMEQVLEKLRLSFNMREINYDPDTETETYSTFNPADYFTGSSGYALGYEYNDSDDTGIVIIDEKKEQHYLSSSNTRGTLKDTLQKPLIFVATVVDQFGNVVDYDPDKYRVQWSIRIPDSRGTYYHPKAWNNDFDAEADTCSVKERWECEKSTNYRPVNGTYPDIQSELTGNGFDWVGDYYRKANNKTSQWACDRWGEYAVIGSTTFKIHPNLLHCTSGFDVRAMLYDVDDPENPVETVISFSQVDFNTERVEGGYKATVSWRADDTPYTSGSAYSFTWYSNPDPTDYDGWKEVKGAGVDFITPGGFPAGYKDDRQRYSIITGVDPTLFYKVEFRTKSGTFIEGIMGPEDVIFVYDRSLTLQHPDFHEFDVYDVQTNYYFPQGDDTNHGRDPWHAVATMGQAFKLLDQNGTYRTNRIVVMGYYHEYIPGSKENYFMHKTWWDKHPGKPTTMCGAYGGNIKGGTLGLGYDAKDYYFDTYLVKPMRWENLSIFTYNHLASNYNCLYAYNHDFIIDKNVRLINFNPLTINGGLAADVVVPNLTLVVGAYDYMCEKKWVNPIDEMNGDYAISYEGNEVPGVTTIKIHSAGLGRMIGSARNNGVVGEPALYGTPTNPSRARIEIDVPHEKGHESEYLPDWTLVEANGSKASQPLHFTHDFGIVVGGQTDGSTFADVQYDIYNGRIARFVSGSITFGRPISVYGHPDDAYFGRTVLNIHGGTFDELFGGSLGRSGYGGDNMVKAFFYGQSIINLYDGVIGSSKQPTSAKVFAAGAGGVTGKGHMWGVDGIADDDERKTYTSDDRIPFVTNDGKIEFRPFSEDDPDAQMPMMQYIDTDGTFKDLDLNESHVELNLYGGTIYGSVYGGGLGYGSNLNYKRAPYRILKNEGKLQSLAGNLYGSSCVRLLPNPNPDKPDVVIYGDLYGGGSGDDQYIQDALKSGQTKTINGVTYTLDFTQIAKTFGDMHVQIEAGHVMGNVYGGGCGIQKYSEMANIYGNTTLEISGGTIDGNIYGGAGFSDIRKYYSTDAEGTKTYAGGNASSYISGGTIGNCIFGGGMGAYEKDNPEKTTSSNIDGDVYLEITGGAFSDEYEYSENQPKAFNIYGGGYLNGNIRGNTHLVMKASPLVNTASINKQFTEAWSDILDRRFCVYGAGYGDRTRVEGNTLVEIDIDPEKYPVEPTINDIDHLIPGQTIFDVAGGGYSGNVGYWADAAGNPMYKQAEPDVEDYDHYVGGKLQVRVKGYPFIRKVIGGSFYAECNTTNTFIESGSIKEVYGGALMGYVHDNARLNVGSKAIAGLESDGFDEVAKKEASEAALCNSHLFITGNIYGGNDVKGIVGTTFWTNDTPGDATYGKRGKEYSDLAPLFCSDVSEALNKGVTMFIHGGTIGGSVFGAGNGHYRGYYVPDWVRYDDGPDRHYRKVLLTSDDGTQAYGKVYRCRPMTGSVTMHIGGNTEQDRVSILGNVYGGGRSCTIGQWNTVLPYEDPRRLVKAGFLHMNFGSHVDAKSVYMGAQGDDFIRPKEVPANGIVIGDGEKPKTTDLDDLGDVAYDHWYLTQDGTKYLPGFPPPGEVDGNYGMLGEHMLRGYAKNIEMNADIELTFYSNPFRFDDQNKPVMSDDNSTVLCKKWLPAELAHTRYNSKDVIFENFFGGGASGFMTNNKLMRYNYSTTRPLPDIEYTYYYDPSKPEGSRYGVTYDFHNDTSADIENFGTIYRYTLSPGVKILDKVVGGSEDALDHVMAYEANLDGSIKFNGDTLYTFEGGMVTQCSYTYDLIVHNDKYWDGYQENFDHAIPAAHFANQKYEDSYTLKHGPDANKTIYRWHIGEKSTNPNATDILHHRYDLAYYLDDDGVQHAYCGPRESRIKGNETVLKLTVGCQFDPQEGDATPAAAAADSESGAGEEETADEHNAHFGGVIYGGCFNSGVTQGDVIVSVSSNTVGDHLQPDESSSFGAISSLAHNVGRVFGGGYGPDSRIDGDTYVNLLLNFVGMNVFGGGCRGNVNGSSHVKYLADEQKSYVFGAIYGGGLYGTVGIPGETTKATEVRLFSGNVDKVYGGSCLGDLYGRTDVEICDEITSDLEYFDYKHLVDNKDIDPWGGSRLIAGSVFGGNDISGKITPQPGNPEDYKTTDEYDKDTYATYVRTYETPSPKAGSSSTGSDDIGPGKDTPGANGAFNGYPLIGYLYAGSNGNYGNRAKNDDGAVVYTSNDDGTPAKVQLATGIGNGVMTLNLSDVPAAGSGDAEAGEGPEGDAELAFAAPAKVAEGEGDAAEGEGGAEGDAEESTSKAFEVPNVTRARIDLEGGTVVNAYGGGDRATITGKTQINVNYDPNSDIMDARAGFLSDDELVRVWNTFHLSHTDQIDDVTTMVKNSDGGTDRVFKYHIYRLFGGNDKATMAIQPSWNLSSGHLGNVYSGGNFGAMTYFERIADKPVGLTLAINSRNFHANAVYGGGRVGDITPAVDAAFEANEVLYAQEQEGALEAAGGDASEGDPEGDPEGDASDPTPENEVANFYGATLNIDDGVIDHVYGGNDVSGKVNYGTQVLLHGAISGDVYCAGNGNYLYKYDPKLTGTDIQETFDAALGRYFLLPRCDVYGGENPTKVEKILAINHYRPSVDRSFLHIEGKKAEDTVDDEGNSVDGEILYAYVHGNVYCGGNSSTVGVGLDRIGKTNDIRFDIGKYVMLSGVFLGSNGENLVDPSMMRAFEEMNGVNLADNTEGLPTNEIEERYSSDFALNDREVVEKPELFPHLLDVYMRAVDVYSTPRDFEMKRENLEKSYIGDFYVGGNRGSMLTSNTISLTFPHNLVIFGKIVGGSNNANINYKGVKHTGGLTRQTATANQDKIYLQVLSKFEPWKMTYPATDQFGRTDYRYIEVVPDVDEVDGNMYFPESKCSVFGGCFNSGHTEGNIHIDLYSDLAGEYDPQSDIYKAIEEAYHIGTGSRDVTKERIIVNGIDKLQRRSFALIGAGYGRETSVLGNVRLHMLPGKFHPSWQTNDDEDPSAATVFAGSEKGELTGNTEITVRDGCVLSNLYGGSESSTMYGSTNIIIGWPKYYICKKTGHYKLDRTDTQSRAARGILVKAKDTDEDPVKSDIWLCEGDYLSVNLFRQLKHEQTEIDGLTYYAPDSDNPDGSFKDASGNSAFEWVDDDTPEKYASHNNSPYIKFTDLTWDDINIYIGNRESRLSNRAEYYAHGNIYGGGFITANSGTTLAGAYTVRKFDEDHTLDPSLIGYGGNSTILIWDNADNANLANPVGGNVRNLKDDGSLENETEGTGAKVRDHITIGTGYYKPVNLVKGQDVMGYYKFVPDSAGRYELNGTHGFYVHQSSHILEDGEDGTFYEIESDGGIYGGGRKVYVEGFRNCDLAYYGYADYTPQNPKLLNTAQRLDLFTLTDCCLMMQGAVDFASNSIDATRYSMTRIGELEMRSSISKDSDLEPGKRDGTALANVIYDVPRTRNYLAFFHDVLYISALTSSEAFTNPYRGANGAIGYTGNLLLDPETLEAAHIVPDSADYLSLPASFSYRDFKVNRIGNYYANRNLPNTATDAEDKIKDNRPIKLLTSVEFDQRNLGTAANMIGICNGYTLKVQGAVVNSLNRDEIYYGPVNGVFEVKLMTLAPDEGGGYIYALNQHDNPNHFLESTGNFVFPGAAYRTTSSGTDSAFKNKTKEAEGGSGDDGDSEGGSGEGDGSESATEETYNYVYDDCFPMDKGWDGYWKWDSSDENESTSVMGPNPRHVETVPDSDTLDAAGQYVCDDPDNHGTEVHFWYVDGSNYYFNVTLTAYTYKEPRFFHINNNEDLIYLNGVDENSAITLESATWSPLSEINVDGYNSDLRNVGSESLKDAYQLFLSIDDQPEIDHTLGDELGLVPSDNHAFTSRIPRADLGVQETSDGDDSEGDSEGTLYTEDTLYTGETAINNYQNRYTVDGETVSNKPLLGVTLYDKCENTAKGYYEDHLSKDELVRLLVKAVNESGRTYQYIINLTVKYVKGPAIDGYVQIENDALPGEYIYANAYGVNIDIDDENMGISKRNWYLVGKDCNVASNTAIQNYFKGIESTSSPEPINDQLISTTDLRQVHIPAYRYRDGWNVVYEIVANGLSFYVAPATVDPSIAALDDDVSAEPAPEAATGHFYPKLTVHNYHRMKPLMPMSSKTEELCLSDGAWIYIEDNTDMAYFFDWLKELQSESCSTEVNGGVVINPRYAEGLTVQLMRDVKMPEGTNTEGLIFKGTFHGNGHNIDMGNNSLFLGTNAGRFYNTGFISSHVVEDGAAVFKANSGSIDCCFFYNDQAEEKGEMIDDAHNTGTIANCYTTSLQDSNHYSQGLSYASRDDFRYGRVAYDLNRFYLQKRYNLAAGLPDGDELEPINAKFRDGEYRYGGVYSAEYPFLLRTDSIPNYRDYQGLRIDATPEEVSAGTVLGTVATMHNIDEPVDMSRVVLGDDSKPLLVDGKEQYKPIFRDDYLFFGQDLTFGSTDKYPHAGYASNRVYRASGFYGSKVDEGFHFNKEIYALQPTLTAIDFSGVRDSQHKSANAGVVNGSSKYAGVDSPTRRLGFTQGRNSFTDDRAEVDQKVWYGPQLDLPDLKASTFDVGTRLEEEKSGSIPDTHITRNLLVYRQTDSVPALSAFLYDTSKPYEEVYCHVVDVPDPENVDAEDAAPNADYVQLVDKEDFNAPIAFNVNRTIWYRRLPSVWANRHDGWEGICLPFTANIVYGSVASRVPESPKNHGLMTHFYGDLNTDTPDQDSDEYWTRQSHEYWLRKFVGVEGDNAYFERPASPLDKDVNATLPETTFGKYHYSNEYFMNAFSNLRYDEEGTHHVPPPYTAAGTDYDEYPMLTAHYPYLVSFPGLRYYEFDCTGQFYSSRTGDGDPDPQIITYAWDSEKSEPEKMQVGISDNSMVTFTHDGQQFVGTFMHHQADNNEVVVDADLETNASTLIRPTDSESKTVLPFRAYLRRSSSPVKPLLISSRGVDTIGDGDGDEFRDNPDDESYEAALEIYLDGNVLVVDNPYNFDLSAPLCDIAGRVLRVLDILPGKNLYDNLTQGFYLLSSFKFRIP